MNFKNILSAIEKTDQEALEKTSGRREVLKSFGSKVAVAALPFAIGSVFNKATAGTPAAKTTVTDPVADALNAILEQEYLGYAFIRHGNNTGALIPAADLPGFQAIEAHKKALIGFLNTTITGLGGTPFKPNHYTDPSTNAPYVPAAYDFTKSGAYPTVFSNYGTFLLLGQVIEDTGIHLVKGQISVFTGNVGLLTQIFQLQATKARHAAFVRLMRRLIPAVSPEYPAPWITNNIPPTIAFQPAYVSEDNVEQKNIVITTLPDVYGALGVVPQVSATGAFDEPYTLTDSKTLMAGFKVL